MRNIYKILVSILILVMAAMLMSAKEPLNVEPKLQDSEMIGGSIDNNIYMQVCCLKEYYFLSEGNNYMSIPVSVEIWDGNLNPIKPRVNVTAILAYQYPDNENQSIISSRTKLTDSHGRVKFGYQIEDVDRWYILYLSTNRTSYASIFFVSYAPCDACSISRKEINNLTSPTKWNNLTSPTKWNNLTSPTRLKAS